MKIVLVEPDRVLSAVLKQALHQAGYIVVHARSAQAALDAADEQPDLIILEPQLGLHNGIEFLYELRSYTEWQDIPVIVHTMNNNLLEAQFGPALQDLGVRSVLYKPRTTTQQLIDSLSTVGVA